MAFNMAWFKAQEEKKKAAEAAKLETEIPEYNLPLYPHKGVH